VLFERSIDSSGGLQPACAQRLNAEPTSKVGFGPLNMDQSLCERLRFLPAIAGVSTRSTMTVTMTFRAQAG